MFGTFYACSDAFLDIQRHTFPYLRNAVEKKMVVGSIENLIEDALKLRAS